MPMRVPRAAGSDSENEEEDEEEEDEEEDELGVGEAPMRNGDDVDPVLRIEGHEEDGSDDDDDDETVPVPVVVTSASGLGGSAPPTKKPALPHKATTQRKLPFGAPKVSKAPATAPPQPPQPPPPPPALKPPASATPPPPEAPAPVPAPAPADAGSEGDEEDGEEQAMTFSMGQRRVPSFASYDAAADAEAQRKRQQTDPTSVVAETPVEPQVDAEIAQEELILRDPKVQKYVVVRASQRRHQRFSATAPLYAPCPMSHANYSKNRYGKKGGWIDELINEQASKVLATLAIAETKWVGDAEGHISLVACVRVELQKDDSVSDKQFNDFVRKMPQVPSAGLYVQLEERHVTRLYDITDCGLPTRYHPKHAHVHYRTVHKMEDHALVDPDWVLWSPPPKPRSSGGRKSPAAKETERAEPAKKQKVSHQTVLTGVAPTPAAVSAEGQSTALVVVGDEEEEEEQAAAVSMANGVHEHSEEGESVQPPVARAAAQPQPQPLVPAAAAAAATLTVPQWACKLPAVHWQNNGAGTLTANLPDAYTYTLVPHGNGTLLIANLAP